MPRRIGKRPSRGSKRSARNSNDSPQLIASLDCWTGDCYVQQGNPDQAVAAFRRVLSVDKTFFKARDGIARIFINDGKFKEAADEYGEAVLANPGDVDAWLALARARVDLNLRRSPAEQEWDKVEELLRQVESIAPGNVQIMSLFAEMRLAQGRAKDADDLLKALREAAPDGVPFAVAQANLAAQRGELDRARKILDEAQVRLDKARDAILVEARQANLDQVKKARLDAARQANLDDQVRLRLARVPILLRELGSAGRGRDREAGCGGRHGGVALLPQQKTRLWSGLLGYLLDLKEYDAAKRLCRQIADLQPHDATIRYRLLELALKTHDAHEPAASLAEVDRLLEEIDRIADKGPLWHYGMAVRLKLEAGQAGTAAVGGTVGQGHGRSREGAQTAAVVVSSPCPPGRDLP